MNQTPNTGNNPFAPPQAEVADVAVSGSQLAGRGNRFLAVLVDTALQIGVLLVVNLVLPWSLFADDASLLQLALNGLLGLVVLLLVHGTLLVQRGQTVGKMLLGVRIVRSDGSRVGAARILGLRYGLGFGIAIIPIVGVIYSLIDALLIFRESRKCLHDQIADTIVVKA